MKIAAAGEEKAIIFSGEMVRAMLEGHKTQTRRIMKPQPERRPVPCHYSDSGWGLEGLENDRGIKGCDCVKVPCPYWPGLRLWVRESWGTIFREDVWKEDKDTVHYRATEPAFFEKFKAHPSIHMPRWMSRITLEISDVRAEKLQDISEEDFLAEGFSYHAGRGRMGIGGWRFNGNDGGVYPTHRDACKALWDSIYGVDSWGSNPWVWVLDFTVL